MAKHNRLPPLQALVYFESAARHTSFTAAARELGTTQPAVSQRVTQLEQDLGTELFERLHRGVQLTTHGLQLFHIVADCLRNIGSEAEIIRLKSKKNRMHIATDMGFATYWLLPRITALTTLLPGVDIQISTSAEEFRHKDNPADIAILFGDGHWSGCQADKLFPEMVIPVCSPCYARDHGTPRTLGDYANHRLLSLPESHPKRWMDWPEWFSVQDAELPHTLSPITLNAYSLVIQAALQGQGVALGWFPLVNDLLARGELIKTATQRVTTQRGYYLVRPSHGIYSSHHDKIRGWLLDEAFALRADEITHAKFI